MSTGRNCVLFRSWKKNVGSLWLPVLSPLDAPPPYPRFSHFSASLVPTVDILQSSYHKSERFFLAVDDLKCITMGYGIRAVVILARLSARPPASFAIRK